MVKLGGTRLEMRISRIRWVALHGGQDERGEIEMVWTCKRRCIDAPIRKVREVGYRTHEERHR